MAELDSGVEEKIIWQYLTGQECATGYENTRVKLTNG